MRRFISLLITGFLALGAFTSCNLDKDLKCTFQYECIVNIQDEAVQKAMEEYMDAHFVKRNDLPTYFGKLYDAKVQFIDYFSKSIQEADHTFIKSQLTHEEDHIILQGILSSEMGRDWMGTMTWAYQAPGSE
jgi:hypothetical protein